MRLYRDLDEVMSEIGRDLKELGVVYQSENVQDMDVSQDPGYETHELMSYAYSIPHPQDKLPSIITASENPEYVHEEFNERVNIGMKNPGEAWKLDEDYWRKFLHNGRFSYTYSVRMQWLHEMMQHLHANPTTRQCWLPIWWTQDNMNLGTGVRVPCSLGYHLMVRQDKLHLQYVMRSCDFSKHFEKDVLLALMLQTYISGYLGVDEGTFTHTIFSLHAFAKDLEGIF